ncbi:MAG: HAMP domain-containing sensor histidine kinase [Synechococcaceae cyanobacterium]|nr:HAMP domain-containing sensor histidine kinase [Synechococcaceae cyanobacterium]
MQPDLDHTRRALTRRYGILISALLLVFALGVYGQVSRARSELQRRQVEQLARTAAAELPLLHHEHDEMLHSDVPAWLREQARGALDSREAFGDDDLRLRWLDDQLLELKSRGDFRPDGPTIPPAPDRGRRQWMPLANGLAYWRPVFSQPLRGRGQELQGYVSVALASAASDAELGRLRQGLLIGAGLAGLLGFVGSQWMVAASLKPIHRQIERLIRFTADASHELRHPLTAIRAVIGTLRHGELLQGCPPRVGRKLEQIDQSTARMGRLLDDLLLLSRTDRAIHESRVQVDFPLEELVEDLIDLHQAEAAAAGVRLQGRIGGSARVRGEPERLRRILENLLANALRFSPMGGTVTVGLMPLRDRVRLWVDDEGPGIPPEQRDQVFERFWQADAARSSPDHHGLGLSIAQAIDSPRPTRAASRPGRPPAGAVAWCWSCPGRPDSGSRPRLFTSSPR